MVKGGGHIIVLDGDGRTVASIAASPGDSRTLKNSRADLRRAGVAV